VNCLVTGATGFIGAALCASLRAHGHSLLAVSCSGSKLPDGTATHAVDLAQGSLPGALLDDVDIVFHLAGIAHQRAARESYQQLNHRATIELARAARAAGVRRFVFLSSVKAMGPADTVQPRGENDCVPPTDFYGLSKWQAECDLRSEFTGLDMALTIIRPALVYGSEAKGNLALLDRGIHMGLPRPPEEGGRSMIALQDLVELLNKAASDHAAGIKTWIACDGQQYSTRRVYDLLRRRAGKGVGLAWCPRWLWRLAASVYDLLSPATESIWDKLFATELYSNQALCDDLGWVPGLTLDAVLTAPERSPGQ
jgi:UDP-N-acetyl-alpha-D-quinovosamine dehydrogenase